MTDQDPDWRDTWPWWINRIIVASVIGFVLVVTVYNWVRIGTIYKNSQEIVKVQSDLTAIRMEHDTAIRDATARLDTIEKTLFGEVVTKLEKVPLTERVARQIQIIQEAKDKELRERIARLERRLSVLEN